MSKHSHISAIFDNAFQSRAGSPDVYMSMEENMLNNMADTCVRLASRPGLCQTYIGVREWLLTLYGVVALTNNMEEIFRQLYVSSRKHVKNL